MGSDYVLPFTGKTLENLICSDLIKLPYGEKMIGFDARYFALQRYHFYFQVPDGTQITASRSGRVIEKRSSIQDIGKLMPRYAHNTNLVIVDHGDNTFARYEHLFPEVKKGQEVDTGDLLGVLGGYAYGTNPHFHVKFSRKMLIFLMNHEIIMKPWSR